MLIRFFLIKILYLKLIKCQKSTQSLICLIKKQGSPAYEERENQLVKEILNEIDNENSQSAPQEPAGPILKNNKLSTNDATTNDGTTNDGATNDGTTTNATTTQ